jgi:prophage antirepressor-like protein
MEIKLFSFQDKEVRTILQGRDVWFVAMDVFKALSMTWKGGNNLRADKKIPDSWIMISGFQTSGGLQDMVLINEQALYKLAFTAKPKNKKTAAQIDAFTNWVAELLVRIRKGSIRPFAGERNEDHLIPSIQKQNSKAINSKMYFEGNVEAIKKHNTINCEVHTGKKPSEVKDIGKALGLKSKDRTSAKEVLRHVKPEIAASMSMADRLAGEKNIDSKTAAETCREFAVPLFKKLIEIGANSTLHLSE